MRTTPRTCLKFDFFGPARPWAQRPCPNPSPGRKEAKMTKILKNPKFCQESVCDDGWCCWGLGEMCRLPDPRGRRVARQSSASKRHLIFMPTFVDVPEIKLIRTDTTLDLSQKAEKVCFCLVFCLALYRTGSNKRVTGPRKTEFLAQFSTQILTSSISAKFSSKNSSKFQGSLVSWLRLFILTHTGVLSESPWQTKTICHRNQTLKKQAYKFFQNWLRVLFRTNFTTLLLYTWKQTSFGINLGTAGSEPSVRANGDYSQTARVP